MHHMVVSGTPSNSLERPGYRARIRVSKWVSGAFEVPVVRAHHRHRAAGRHRGRPPTCARRLSVRGCSGLLRHHARRPGPVSKLNRLIQTHSKLAA
jgi:hypothetical protein